MDAATTNQAWLSVGLLLLLLLLGLPTYVGGRLLRLSVGLHNASASAADAVPTPDRGTAMSVVFLATLFNLMVTWAYINSRDQEGAPPSRRRSGFEEEQEFRLTAKPLTLEQKVNLAILILRAFLFGLALVVLTRLLVPATPWQAFVITGTLWLIGGGILALLVFFLGIEAVLPKSM